MKNLVTRITFANVEIVSDYYYSKEQTLLLINNLIIIITYK